MLRLDPSDKSVSFSGKIFPSQFNGWLSWTKHHHFIVYKGGRAAFNALIESDASDLEILDALETLGARAGNNLSVDAWEKRADPRNPEPDRRVEGSVIDALVSWEGQTPLRADEIFDDVFGNGFRFKFGGHRALMDVWKSGCVVCLQSCPGGRVSNANYTLRDWHAGKARFEAKKHRLPKDATPVVVTLKILSD